MSVEPFNPYAMVAAPSKRKASNDDGAATALASNAADGAKRPKPAAEAEKQFSDSKSQSSNAPKAAQATNDEIKS